MFREMARKKQELSRQECLEILRQQKRGVLSVLGDEGYPYGMPLNHYYDEQDDVIFFHGSRRGHKIDALRKCDKVSYCVYDEGYLKEGDWALNIRSVIVFGRIEFIDDLDRVCDICRRLSYRFTDDDSYIEEEIRRSASATLLLALKPEHISGKLVNEK